MAPLPSPRWGGTKRNVHARFSAGHEPGSLFCRDAALCAFVALGLPILLFMTHHAALNRMIYPASSLLLAGFLYRRRSPWFLGLCLWLFCAVSLVRRLTDMQAGWDPANPVLIAPYLACMLAAFSLPPYVTRLRKPYATPFLLILGCVAYGTLLAILDERLMSGLVDALRWSVGPLCAIYLLRHADMQPALRNVVVVSLLVAGPLMAAYGIAQFLQPQQWDREWMINVEGLDSIGQPVPFQVRVFSTANSPASLSMFLLVCSLLYVGQPLLFMLPAMLPIGVCLALTQYRAGWGGLAFGLFCILLGGASLQKLRVMAMLLTLLFASSFLALVPEINQTIGDRLNTLSHLSNDRSGEDRLAQYAAFFMNTDNIVEGQGLAISGATRLLDGKAGTVIDGGVMEPFLAFGIFGATCFLMSIMVLVRAIWRMPRMPCRDMPLYRAIVAGSFSQLLFGRVLMGEAGICAWLMIGLALSVIGGRTLRSNARRHMASAGSFKGE